MNTWCWVWRLLGVRWSSYNIQVLSALGLVIDLHYDFVGFLVIIISSSFVIFLFLFLLFSRMSRRYFFLLFLSKPACSFQFRRQALPCGEALREGISRTPPPGIQASGWNATTASFSTTLGLPLLTKHRSVSHHASVTLHLTPPRNTGRGWRRRSRRRRAGRAAIPAAPQWLGCRGSVGGRVTAVR